MRSSASVVAPGSSVVKPSASPRSAWREPGFVRYLSGQSISLLGNQVWNVALSWSAVHLASAGVAGVLLTLSSLPRLVLMLLGGVIADRFDIRRLMIGSDIVRTLITVAAAGLAVLQPGIALLAVLSLVFGLVDAVFMPAAGGMQPRLLAPSQYAGGAVLANLASRTALSIGAPLGGILVATGGVPLALLIDAATFAISVITLATVHPRPVQEPVSAPPMRTPRESPTVAGRGVVLDSAVPGRGGECACAPGRGGDSAASVAGSSDSPSVPARPSYGAELRDGLRFLLHHRVLGPMTLAFLLINVGFVGPMNIGIAELAERRGWGAAGIGILLTGFGVGAALGGLLTPRLRIRRDAGLWIALLGAAQGLGLLSVAFVPNAALAAALTAWAGLTSGPMAVLASVIQQSQTPDSYRGRVTSISTLISLGVVPLASAATGFIIAAVGLSADFVISGLIEVAAVATLAAPEYRRAQASRD
jgi:MFS family permease